MDAKSAILKVEDFHYAVSQLAQTTMRDIVGEVELDELLTNREDISNRIRTLVDKATDPWGIQIESVDLKHIELPGGMKRTIAKQAEAEREKRGVIIKSEGELEAAQNLQKAAEELGRAPHAIELRRLSTLADVSQDQSNTIVFAVPLESLTGAMAATSGLQVPKPTKTE